MNFHLKLIVTNPFIIIIIINAMDMGVVAVICSWHVGYLQQEDFFL